MSSESFDCELPDAAFDRDDFLTSSPTMWPARDSERSSKKKSARDDCVSPSDDDEDQVDETPEKSDQYRREPTRSLTKFPLIKGLRKPVVAMKVEPKETS